MVEEEEEEEEERRVMVGRGRSIRTTFSDDTLRPGNAGPRVLMRKVSFGSFTTVSAAPRSVAMAAGSENHCRRGLSGRALKLEERHLMLDANLMGLSEDEEDTKARRRRRFNRPGSPRRAPPTLAQVAWSSSTARIV